MADQSSVVTSVEGPNGKAEVVEVFKDGSNQPEYHVLFGGKDFPYPTEGEASIEALEMVGHAR